MLNLLQNSRQFIAELKKLSIYLNAVLEVFWFRPAKQTSPRMFSTKGPFFLEMYVRMKDLHEQLSKHFEAWEAKNSAFVWRDAFVKEYHSG